MLTRRYVLVLLALPGLGGNVQVVQNSLGAILDAVESGYNAFNFVVSSNRAMN